MPTEYNPLSIACPSCNTTGVIPIFDMLDLAESSDSTRALVVSGKVFSFTCQKCGYKEPVSYPMTCFDDEATGAVITVLDEDNKAEDYKKTYREYEMTSRAPGSKYRICDTTQELAEKLRIFEDNMDDRIIELMKMALRAIIAEEVQDYAQIKCTYKRTEGGKVLFSVRAYGERNDAELPASIYADIEASFRRFHDTTGLKSAYMINYTWADKMMAAMAAAAPDDEDE